jgi:hypothetical protein
MIYFTDATREASSLLQTNTETNKSNFAKLHIGFFWEDLREGDHLGDPGVGGRIILKWIFKEWDGAWTGLSWLRIVTGGGLL